MLPATPPRVPLLLHAQTRSPSAMRESSSVAANSENILVAGARLASQPVVKSVMNALPTRRVVYGRRASSGQASIDSGSSS